MRWKFHEWLFRVFHRRVSPYDCYWSRRALTAEKKLETLQAQMNRQDAYIESCLL